MASIAERLGLDRKPVFLMDGTAFIYRGFFASRHIQRSDGYPTNALVVVTRILLRLLREENPKHFLFAMDGKGKSFRNAIYQDYKANRESMPEDLAKQIEPVKRMVGALGLRLEVSSGVEADDCIASLAARFSADNPVVILSGDKDLKQCLGPNVYIWDPGSKDDYVLTAADFERETGYNPAQWPDVQAITGDSSDNIPGVPGIGPKTARQIFDICPSLEDIRDHFGLLPPKIQTKLKDHLEKMFTWRTLTTLTTTALPDIGLDDLQVGPIDLPACRELADEFELFAVRREIASLAEKRLLARMPKTLTNPEAPRQGKEIREDLGLGAAALPSAREIDKLSDLPPCGDCTVAVLCEKNMPPRLALAKTGEKQDWENLGEYAWVGAIRELCAWLNDADEIVLADLKSLLTSDKAWWDLPVGAKPPKIFDLGLASWLLDPEDGNYSFERISRAEEVDVEKPAPRALTLALSLREKLAANELLPLYETIEAPLTPVLARMQEYGIAIDPAAFRNFLDDVDRQICETSQKIYAATGGPFNLRSARQIGEILFGRLKLAPAMKTPGGAPSTSEAALEKLSGANPVVDDILQYRKLDKMRSTYLDPLPRLMDANSRIHTTFNQETTATGRLSSSNPNLQNIPVRGEMGKRMRSCFVAGPGNELVSADYSQIELRILAHLSGDEHLLDAFRKGEDIHARTASLVFDIPQEQLAPDQRRMAKTINFGLLYGMGANKLARELHIPVNKAKEFIERYFSRLKGLRAYYDKVLDGARANGHVATMAGRRRWLPGILSSNGHTAAQAQRQAVNAGIQGSAADIVKLAMLAVAHDEELKELEARLVLQIHDEFLLEVPEGNGRKAGERAARLMESIKPGGEKLSVPLIVDWNVGHDWGTAH